MFTVQAAGSFAYNWLSFSGKGKKRFETYPSSRHSPFWLVSLFLYKSSVVGFSAALKLAKNNDHLYIPSNRAKSLRRWKSFFPRRSCLIATQILKEKAEPYSISTNSAPAYNIGRENRQRAIWAVSGWPIVRSALNGPPTLICSDAYIYIILKAVKRLSHDCCYI